MIIKSQRIKSAKEALALLNSHHRDSAHSNATAFDQKFTSLSALPKAKALLLSDHWLVGRWSRLSLLHRVCLLSLLAIDQEHLFLPDPQKIKDGEEKWRAFLDCLAHTEDFYADIGGVIGYHAKVIDLLTRPQTSKKRSFLPPPKVDITKRTPEIDRAIELALRKWNATALIIAAGGAGDRLNLIKEDGMPLPAAFLNLGGKTLLEAIICDLAGCEHAVFKLTGKRVVTPIAIMTSGEKNNHALISNYLVEQNYFDRPKNRFRLFCQPNVPMISSAGMWVTTDPLQLFTKPGGHGVLWRLAHHLGVFDWFKRQGYQKAIVRQINNCLAGSDVGLLTLAGWGWHTGKSMGFTSCERASAMAEGVNAVVQRSIDRGFAYSLENLEYTELPADLADDRPLSHAYLANVNLLFVDLKTIETLSITAPLPGLTINFKTQIKSQGNEKPVLAGRLESTMQNISSYLALESNGELTEMDFERLPTYAIFCERSKILSAAKRAPSSQALLETAEMAYLDLQRSYFALLKQCGFTMPPWKGGRLPAVIALHPALGPDWQIVAQKIRGGEIEQGSNLHLDLAEIDCEGLQLSGGLQIVSKPMSMEKSQYLPTSSHQLQGRCSLRNVTVNNGGVAKRSSCDYWSHRPQLSGCLTIILHGISEFCAENVSICDSKTVHVPQGYKMRASQQGSDVNFQLMPLVDELWSWNYRYEKDRWQALKNSDLFSPNLS